MENEEIETEWSPDAIRDGAISDEEVEQFIQEQSQRIKELGSLNFRTLQVRVHNFHRDDKVRTKIFERLSYVNTKQKNWERYKRRKEKELGRPMTYEEIQAAHKPVEITQEMLDKLQAECEAIRAYRLAHPEEYAEKNRKLVEQYWKNVWKQN